MKKLILLFVIITLFLIGCGSGSTKKGVYKNPWDEQPIIVQQQDVHGDYEIINEITESNQVKKLVKALNNADWEDDVVVDIAPADYIFTWNDFEHHVWKNEDLERIELLISGQSNYGTMSEASSKIVLEILIGD